MLPCPSFSSSSLCASSSCFLPCHTHTGATCQPSSSPSLPPMALFNGCCHCHPSCFSLIFLFLPITNPTIYGIYMAPSVCCASALVWLLCPVASVDTMPPAATLACQQPFLQAQLHIPHTHTLTHKSKSLTLAIKPSRSWRRRGKPQGAKC